MMLRQAGSQARVFKQLTNRRWDDLQILFSRPCFRHCVPFESETISYVLFLLVVLMWRGREHLRERGHPIRAHRPTTKVTGKSRFLDLRPL